MPIYNGLSQVNKAEIISGGKQMCRVYCKDKLVWQKNVVDTSGNFISTWKTDNVSTGSSTDHQIKLPLKSTGVYNFIVNWGDGSSDTITTYNQAEITHTYTEIGTYVVTCTGTLKGWRFNNSGDKLKFLDISQWGCFNFTSDATATFYGCSNMNVTAIDLLDASYVSNFTSLFSSCASFNYDLSYWDVSNGTDFGGMFGGCSVFNQDLSSWNVSNSLGFRYMFIYCSAFNQDLSSWNVSNSLDFEGMFCFCSAFTSDLSSWDVYNSTSFYGMFTYCSSFTSDLSSWNVSNSNSFEGMFYLCSSFTSDLSSWDVSNSTSFYGMFTYCSSFTSDLSSWNVSNGTNFADMFNSCPAFNSDLSSWNVSSATDLTNMFNASGLSITNYSAILNGWSLLSVQSGVLFGAGIIKYNAGAVAARAILTSSPNNWIITDGGLE